MHKNKGASFHSVARCATPNLIQPSGLAYVVEPSHSVNVLGVIALRRISSSLQFGIQSKQLLHVGDSYQRTATASTFIKTSEDHLQYLCVEPFENP